MRAAVFGSREVSQLSALCGHPSMAEVTGRNDEGIL